MYIVLYRIEGEHMVQMTVLLCPGSAIGQIAMPANLRPHPGTGTGDNSHHVSGLFLWWCYTDISAVRVVSVKSKTLWHIQP